MPVFLVSQGILEPLYEEDIETNGDLHLDIAEAYMDISHFKHALPLLQSLVQTKNYNLVSSDVGMLYTVGNKV